MSNELVAVTLLSVTTIIASLIILIYVYPELFIKIRNKKLRFLHNISLNRLTSLGWKGVERLISLSLKGVVDPLEVARASALQKGCPDERILRDLAKLNLYEEITRHAAKGCNVNPVLLKEAKKHFILMGLPNWERATSSILNEKSFYDMISNNIVYAYCSKKRVWIKAGDFETELAGDMGTFSFRDPREVLWTILESGRPPLFVFLGDECPKPPGIRYVNLAHLASIAFPDIEPNIASFSYNFDLNPKNPASVVEKVARSSRSVLEEIGVRWDKLPETVAYAYMIEPGEKGLISPLGADIIVTDRPKYSLPVFKPYTVAPPTSGEAAEGWDYVALLALKALNLRWGDPAKAFSIKRGSPLDEKLPKLIPGGLKRREDRPPYPIQVEPWHLDAFLKLDGSNKNLVYDCLRPPSCCISARELSEQERSLMNVAGGLPGLDHQPSNKIREVNLRSEVDKLISMNRELESIKFYAGRIPKDPCKLAGLIEKMIERPLKTLVITPSKILSESLSKCLKAFHIRKGDDIITWFYDGNERIAVVSYEDLIKDPWMTSLTENIISVLPEKVTVKYSKLPPDRALFWETLWLVHTLGGTTLSRAVSYLYTKGLLKEAKPFGEPLEGLTSKGSLPNLDATALINYSEKVFKSLWGKDLTLRGYQIDALYALYSSVSLTKSRTLVVILPTGAGKSAIFQVASRVINDLGLGSVSVVISPLRALIHDQVRGALRRGLKVAYIDSTVPKERREEIIDLALSGLLDLLYITPERFEDPEFESLIRRSDVSLVILDEAHTLSRWGMSFRPSYLYMAKVVSEVKAKEGDLPVLALTATASPDVVGDIVEVIEGKREFREIRIDVRAPSQKPKVLPGEVVVLRASPIRDEIRFDVRPAPFGEERINDLSNLLRDLVKWANSKGEPWIGLVYTSYVKSKKLSWANAEEIAKKLSEALGNDKILFYHGKLSSSSRRRVEELLEKVSKGIEDPKILVATKAFGMGIDIPNIRFVVHVMPSDSIEDYYQEVGRAARDGKEAWAIAYYNPEDFEFKERLKRREVIKPSDVLILYNFITSIAKHSKGGRTALLPSEVLIKLLGSRERASRALETLRLSGLLDYTVIEGIPILSEGDCLVKLGGLCISISRKEENLIIGRLSFCMPKESPIPIVGINIGGRRIGEECPEAIDVIFNKDKYYYIELSPWLRHAPRLTLPPDVYLRTLISSTAEINKIKDLKEMLEKAIKARSRGGQGAVDEILKFHIENALEREVRYLRSAEELLKKLGIRECHELKECINEIWEVVKTLEEGIGEGSYVLATTGSELGSILKTYVEQKLGRMIKDPAAEYRRLMSSARRGPHSLLNRGFIILFASSESRSLKIALEKLSDYPYKFVFIYRVPKEKGERKLLA